MTYILYMDDINACYIKEFEATVEKVEKGEDNRIFLDRTAFYPLGGGQPNDTGYLRWKCGSCKVTGVYKNNKVVHIVEGDLPKKGEEIYGEIDWNQRYAHMRMHTAQHLLSALIWDIFKGSTVGNKIHADHSHIDFYSAEINMDDLKIIERKMNDLIKGSSEVTVEKISRERIEKMVEKERVDLTRLPTSIMDIRTIFIGENGCVDICPCAGTHVRNISELKGVKILKRRSKGKGKVRIQYTLL